MGYANKATTSLTPPNKQTKTASKHTSPGLLSAHVLPPGALPVWREKLYIQLCACAVGRAAGAAASRNKAGKGVPRPRQLKKEVKASPPSITPTLADEAAAVAVSPAASLVLTESWDSGEQAQKRW